MLTLLELFLSFVKIGLFGFGGGYAMIPLIQSEITGKQWLSEIEFIKIIGIAEITPGPVAINSATFVGYKVYGVIGSIVATIGVALPSLILLIFISSFLFNHYENKTMKSIFSAVRPAVAGLIFAAAITMAEKTFISSSVLDLSISNFQFITISTFSLILINQYVIKKKIHPIKQILISGIIGLMSYYIA